MTTSTAQAHMHSAALSALLAHDPQGRTNAQIARDAEKTPANIREFQTSVRSGARASTRQAVARALNVPASAITCWCPRPDGRCMSVMEAS